MRDTCRIASIGVNALRLRLDAFDVVLEYGAIFVRRSLWPSPFRVFLGAIFVNYGLQGCRAAQRPLIRRWLSYGQGLPVAL